MEDLQYLVNSPVTSRQLNDLFASSWEGHQWRDFEPVLKRSLGYICAWRADELVGFVNLARDGGIHAFVLDTTVHPYVRRRGVGRGLVKLAVEVARERGVEWVTWTSMRTLVRSTMSVVSVALKLGCCT
jgi:ribosomal protein S18 acetylase RimI-like enzyme